MCVCMLARGEPGERGSRGGSSYLLRLLLCCQGCPVLLICPSLFLLLFLRSLLPSYLTPSYLLHPRPLIFFHPSFYFLLLFFVFPCSTPPRFPKKLLAKWRKLSVCLCIPAALLSALRFSSTQTPDSYCQKLQRSLISSHQSLLSR